MEKIQELYNTMIKKRNIIKQKIEKHMQILKSLEEGSPSWYLQRRTYDELLGRYLSYADIIFLMECGGMVRYENN